MGQQDERPPDEPPQRPADESTSKESVRTRVRHAVLGQPRDVTDKSVFQHLALIPLLAWVGLGADALSSSAYGPEEAFKAIGSHRYLAIALAIATACTVGLISAAYSRIVEHFPNGGGYGVASRLLGPRVGLVSGSALIVDYILTVTISIAAAGAAIFSFVPDSWHAFKLPFEIGLIGGLTILNMRGVKESILILAPFFALFLLTHIVLIGAGLILHAPEAGATARELGTAFRADLADPAMGLLGMLVLFLHAYSLGGGTYTGIEAVSNALPLMREPRVQTAKRTMLYLAVSLALTAGGLLLCYLLWHVHHVPGKTLNAVLAEGIAQNLPFGGTFVVLTLFSEAVLLVVAAQAGFVGGPRVCANMAVDSWMPHALASLSERLTTGNGVLAMGGLSLVALIYTGGSIDTLVVMYSINVFLTFSLTMIGMTRFWWTRKVDGVKTRRWRLTLFIVCSVVCVTILGVTVWTKWQAGGWITLAATSVLVAVCMVVRRHYRLVNKKAAALYSQFGKLKLSDDPPKPIDKSRPTAVILVGGYGALGIHTLLNVQRAFPGHFANIAFVSVGVLDSGAFKGVDTVDEMRARTEDTLKTYVRLATALGLPAASHYSVGTDAVDEAEQLCLQVAKEYPRSVFFAGKLIFQHERWYHRLLHNNTAHAVQARLHWAGKAMVIMPARMT
ncbi:MAG: APC family permease [Planctomycetes bacterium]|nr:APC family permease [Planctomycetota bacterium]